MVVQNTPFKNYNTNNPFIIMCKESYDKVTTKSIQLVKVMIYGAIASAILALSHISLIVRSVREYSMSNPSTIIILGGAAMTLLTAYILFVAIALDKVIISRNESETINMLLKPSLDDMVSMNNESVLKALIELENYNGRADMLIDVTKIYTICILVYAIAVTVLSIFIM